MEAENDPKLEALRQRAARLRLAADALDQRRRRDDPDHLVGSVPAAVRSAFDGPGDIVAPIAPANEGGHAGPAATHVLVVDDDPVMRSLVGNTLEREGYRVTLATDGNDALRVIEADAPAIVVSDVNMPHVDGLTLLARLRESDATRWLPIVLLTSRNEVDQVTEGLALGADDYVTKPFAPAELLARIRVKLERPPVPVESLPTDRTTGLLSAARFTEEVNRELLRATSGGRPGTLAIVELAELPSIALRWGPGAAGTALRTLAGAMWGVLRPLDVIGRIADDRIAILLPELSPQVAESSLRVVSAAIATTPIQILGESLRATPAIGFATFNDGKDASTLLDRAAVAVEFAVGHLDLQPVHWEPRMDAVVTDQRSAARIKSGAEAGGRRRRSTVRTGLQIVATLMLGIVFPFAAYVTLDDIGHDITGVVYLFVVISLAITGGLILVEGLLAFRREDPPDEPAEPYPPATAIIAAYLPNEAATVLDTVDAFLRIAYPANLQIILAYNAPNPLPVERALRDLALRNPQFLPVRVEGSNSKAQNVNAVLPQATGRFVGVFDADHHPDPDSFARAWRWLAEGYDVVQGHCVVRNGDSTVISRMVAVEFEAIYAVAHPGRARLHRFGIFGGSNGFWRTDLLHQIRMQGTMLTEDIDSSLRVLEMGGRIRSDPGLVSRELGTTTLKQVWHQRLRWAQGWFQVSLRHLLKGLRSKTLTTRQKIGLVHLLGWRELYPWLSIQMFPLIAYWLWRGDRLDWMVPIFVLTTMFTLSVGPLQTYFAYRLADPEIRKHGRWFLGYLLFTSVFYTEFKNMIARVAQIKQFMRETDWRVTPRPATPEPLVFANVPRLDDYRNLDGEGDGHEEDRAMIAAMWPSVSKTVAARVEVIAGAVEALASDTLRSEDRNLAVQEAHRLAGALGTFGHPEATNMAARVEAALPLATSADVPALRRMVDGIAAVTRAE